MADLIAFVMADLSVFVMADLSGHLCDRFPVKPGMTAEFHFYRLTVLQSGDQIRTMRLGGRRPTGGV